MKVTIKVKFQRQAGTIADIDLQPNIIASAILLPKLLSLAADYLGVVILGKGFEI
jgi:hypothetical protein